MYRFREDLSKKGSFLPHFAPFLEKILKMCPKRSFFTWKCPIPWKIDPFQAGISTNIPCFRESLAKVHSQLRNFSSRTNLSYTGITKYMEVPPPGPCFSMTPIQHIIWKGKRVQFYGWCHTKAKPSFGITMTKILRPVFTCHSSV